MRAIAVIAGISCVLSLSTAGYANEITANLTGGASWFLSIQGDEANRADITQRARNNFSIMQQIGNQNTIVNSQTGNRNVSVSRQWGGNSSATIAQSPQSSVAHVTQNDMASSPLARYYRTGEFSYFVAFDSNQVNIIAVTPFALPSASFGRAH